MFDHANQQTGQIPKLLMREFWVMSNIMFTVSHVDAVALHQEFPVNLGNKDNSVPREILQCSKRGRRGGKLIKACFAEDRACSAN